MNYNFNKDLSNLVISRKNKSEAFVSIFINCKRKTNQQIMDTLLVSCNQTFENIEIILCNIGKQKLSEKIGLDKRIKIISEEIVNMTQVKKHMSKTSHYFTCIEAGELINKTYIETNLLSLEFKEDCLISFTDSVNLELKKTYNYIFENKVLSNVNIPVPNLFFKKDILSQIEDETIDNIRTWSITASLISDNKTIHQSYYGFATNKEVEFLQEEYLSIERDIFSSDIVSFPYDNYYYDIIKSNLNKLKVIPKKKERKNILLIIPWMVIGGADSFNLDFVRLIDKSKYEVTIITDHPKEYVLRQKFEKYTESVIEMATFLDRKDWPTFLEYMILTRNIDLILISNSITGYNMIPYLKLKFPNIPVMDYIHSVEIYNRNGGYGRDSNMMKSLIDRTLFCSHNAEKSYHNLFDTKDTITKTVYIGVDSDKFKPSEKLVKQARQKYNVDNTINIGYLCRMDYPKRPLLLAEIIKKAVVVNPKIKFIIGGEGTLLKELKNKIEEYHLEEKVLFLGNVTNPQEFYSMCDMTINCSIKEGLALTTYESLSMGVPIVSADVGGHKELIDDSCGVIVPLMQKEEDIREFVYQEEEIDNYVVAIKTIINNLDNYKKNSRKRIENQFTLNKMIHEMENEIESCIQENRRLSNSRQIKNNENIVYEYINNYFMGSQYEYCTLINRYYDFFNSLKEANEETEQTEEINTPPVKWYYCQEYFLIKDLLKSIVKIIIFPLRFIYIVMKRIKKILGGRHEK